MWISASYQNEYRKWIADGMFEEIYHREGKPLLNRN